MSDIRNAVSQGETAEALPMYATSSGAFLASVVGFSWLIAAVYATCVFLALT
jgi:hypothetical protein